MDDAIDQPTKSEPEGQPADSLTTDSLWERWAIVFLLLAYLSLALAYSIVNPLHEATDELRHYRFVRIIATTGRLPVQGQEPCRSQSHHPPLFYALGAVATAWIDTGREVCYNPPENPFWAYRYWEVGRDNKNQYLHGPDEAFPWHGEALAAHIIRIINVLIGAGVVWLTWATGRSIWPGNPAMALGAAALVALNPMFLYMAGAINNDILAALSGVAVLYGCVRLVSDPKGLSWRWGLILGALYGLALMSKFNLAVILVLIEAAVTWVAWRKKQWRGWLTVNAFILLTAGLLAGWWFVRNQLLYGEPTGFQEVTELWGVRDPRQSLGLALSELPYAWTTLWGRFGFGQIPLPAGIYSTLLILSAAGLLGALAGFFRSRTAEERVKLFLLALNVVLFVAVLFNYMLVSPAGPNGRFFFPALSGLALLIFFGWSQWLEWIVASVGRARQTKSATGSGEASAIPLTLVTGLGLFALALVALFGYLAPAYARPPALPEDAEIPNPVNVHFDQLVTLLGYDLSTTSLQPGEPVDVRLYWQVDAQPPGNYLLFVHMVDEAGTMVTQRDTHPGLGNFPASQWRPGDRFVESIRLYLPETAYVPATARLKMGLYAPDSYRLAVVGQDGQELGDAFDLGPVQLTPPEGSYPNPQDQNFGNVLRLVGYEYDRRQVPVGEDLAVTLYWQTIDGPPINSVVRLRVLDGGGHVWSEVDSDFAGKSSSAAEWQAAETVRQVNLLPLDPAAPPGRYRVDLAVVDGQTSENLYIVAEDGHLVDSHLSLAEIAVVSP